MATEGERAHRGGGGGAGSGSDLFVCFTSRSFSSSSSSLMKIPSKSLLSPARARDGSGSSSSSMLYTSLSRRLRHSGSLKGGGQASPMFPPAGSGKKKGAGFEAAAEPSSPKVTCIGQVRVKTRKQGKRVRAAAATRSRSRRRGEGGSFREERRRSQRWAALPISICEAVRALGSEFNCFHPCGAQSWCASTSTTEREKAEKRTTTTTRSYCGDVFARWLVALHDGAEEEQMKGGTREAIEVALVREERKGVVELEKSLERRGEAVVEEVEAEFQVCVPPKNALLLMRCRSEPFRMASYANRIWESPSMAETLNGVEKEKEGEEDEGNATPSEEKEQGEEEVEKKEEEDLGEEIKFEEKGNILLENGEGDCAEVDVNIAGRKSVGLEAEWGEVTKEERDEQGRSSVGVEAQQREEIKEEGSEQEEKIELSADELVADRCASPEVADEAIAIDGNIHDEMISKMESPETEESREAEIEEEEKTQLTEVETDEEEDAQLVQINLLEEEKPPEEEEEEEDGEEGEEEDGYEGEEEAPEEKGRESLSSATTLHPEEARAAEEVADTGAEEGPAPEVERGMDEEKEDALPECLLLMLYEPKLSMEVSKETWVCSTDFLHWRPGKERRLKAGGDAVGGGGGALEGRRNSTDSRPTRHSANRVTAVKAALPPQSMASVVEEKLVKAAAYEPMVLTRCKSEPLRSSAKLAPEACFWKSGRKLQQQHHPLRAGAAGVGF